jgi:formylglycine-generating enzyme required for sulfatase activity
VIWDDGQAFIAKLNKESRPGSAKFGLPTEAQWEYACRAGTTTRYSFGDDEAKLDDYAWWFDNSNGTTSFPTTHPVGQKKPNAWGLYDMHGNVGELCADWWDYYAKSPAEDPVGPDSGDFRVLRGGSWRHGLPGYFRCAYRDLSDPVHRLHFNGFRVARTLTP